MFIITKDTTYYVFARVYCSNSKDDSYWLKVDNGNYVKYDNLITTGWQWVRLASADLSAGEHTVAIAYSEDGAKFDKLCISDLSYVPYGLGDSAAVICEPVLNTGIANNVQELDGYKLEQNYPNPFNGKTSIAFTIPDNSFVSLKVYNIFGTEVAELAGKKFQQGKHTLEFNSKDFSKGIYFYTLKTSNCTLNRKMVLE